MSVALNNAVIRGEKAIAPANDAEIASPFNDGFYVGTGGTVTFSYVSAPTVKHTKTFADGDTWFANKIFSIDATGTLASNITGLRLNL